MSEFKGTKGQITFLNVKEGIAKGIYLRGENQTRFLAKIIDGDRSDQENLANAKLFSKSQEMFEMLKKLTEEYRVHSVPHLGTIMDTERLLKSVTKI